MSDITAESSEKLLSPTKLIRIIRPSKIGTPTDFVPAEPRRIEEVVVGGVKLDLEVLDEKIIKPESGRSPYQSTVVQWVKGYHPVLGLPIQGLQGSETVIVKNITNSPNSPDGRSVSREKVKSVIIKRLKDSGIQVTVTPDNSKEAIDYYISKNTQKPRAKY